MIEIAPMSYEMMPYDQAFLYTLTCTLHGCYDWRLPTFDEWRDHSPNIVGWNDKGKLTPEEFRACTDSSIHRCYVNPVRDIND